ncbi:hypothetical protein QEZ54_22445 [Catellatospora sp. KI3]|uniref:hypothetical protein n=1 Tax=Catellatospora sp. KI3 TaxID=3041620 RepID=UPI002482A4DC|nr:hypothetical protein [Catellatospora sp. KI3]MDI1463748.1 hypothetical protein [Catellatospora sp. KI3]
MTDDDVVRIIRRHLHPDTGSPYWRDRDAALGSAAYEKVGGFADAQALVGLRDEEDQLAYEEATRRRPVEDFIPADVVAGERFLWASQTGGTTGLPKHGTWGSTYWKQVREFSHAFMDRYGVPRGENWLFVGPMGPHTTGRLIVDFAESRGGRCFSIDLDPRIVKIYGEEGMTAASDRYVRHLWDQIEAIVVSQRIGVMFCTSRLLEMLPEYLDPCLFAGVRAIVHAGTTMEPETNRLLRESVFPGVPVIGVYGTSTTGISWQKPFEDADDHRVVYIPCSPYVLLDLVDDEGAPVPFGDEGRVRVWRLTDDQLIPGFLERDRGRRVRPYGEAAEEFPWPWLGDPYSPEFTQLGRVEGVY